jgi:hypothetical protein
VLRICVVHVLCGCACVLRVVCYVFIVCFCCVLCVVCCAFLAR